MVVIFLGKIDTKSILVDTSHDVTLRRPKKIDHRALKKFTREERSIWIFY